MRNWRLRRGITALALALLALPAVPGTALAEPTYPFRDPHLPVNARVDDLLGRLTLDEKISLLHQYQPAIPRLGIGLFKTGTEALHGVAWSTDIDNNGAVVTAERHRLPAGRRPGQHLGPRRWSGRSARPSATRRAATTRRTPTVWGLNLWAPVVNLLRDPRWGRNEEGYSEDPLLTGAISTAYGSGLEGDDPRPPEDGARRSSTSSPTTTRSAAT